MLGHLIDRVESFFKDMGVSSPRELDFKALAASNSAKLFYAPRKSHAITIFRDDGSVEHICVVNSKETNEVQRVHASLEISHTFLFSESETKIVDVFRVFQEPQVIQLAGHIFAPSFLLREYFKWISPCSNDCVEFLANEFCVTREAMRQRINDFLLRTFF
ncbi:hypothetical protein [Alicyclobacillus sendaiensis]|uniref:Uncharacterized protein n=1 Tax=Alicyclobacillus sendaiensis PA2 TaxID=3029425 RepID=A0ABT6Y1S1_ALISE|nr:hypothetical protein [Alicyclobacillus sendaiensis]MDI9261271.1 hypothetical protein [Alicyclobacillus sendaiensis PA2]